MSTVWIVHRDPAARAALARLAAASQEALLGSPRDPIFDVASGAQVVVLGIGVDFEEELEFAHRAAARLPGCSWILLSTDVDPGPLRDLFDSLPLTVLQWPPDPATLRAAVRTALARRPAVDSLSQRRYRDRLQARFARWFADLDLPSLLRAIDPSVGPVPLLVRGECGTGRELVARYVHTFGGPEGEGSPFVPVTCSAVTSERQLLEQIESGLAGCRGRCTVWLDELDRLSAAAQRAVQRWIEFGAESGGLGRVDARWMASVRDGFPQSLPDLEPGLLAALGGLALRIAPLRERSDAIEPIAVDLLRQVAATGSHDRTLSAEALAALRSHPWPENTRELEAVLLRTAAATAAEPIEARHLCFEPVGPQMFGAGLALPRAVPADLIDLEDDDTTTSRSDEGAPGEAQAKPLAKVRRENELLQPIYLDDPLEETLALAASPRATTVPPPPAATGPVGAGSVSPRPIAARPVLVSPKPADRAGSTESTGSTGSSDGSWRRLLQAVTHEVRNPLVSIRSLAELLPDHYQEADFRARMSELVGADVRRIEAVLSHLQGLAVEGAGQRQPVDVAQLIDTLLEEMRDEIQSRRLLVLRELDRTQPIALADLLQLRTALGALFAKSLELVHERGDVYVATRHHVAGLRGEPSVRILLRYQPLPSASAAASSASPEAQSDTSMPANAVEFALAEAVVKAQGGAFAFDTGRDGETVVVIDLPAPL